MPLEYSEHGRGLRTEGQVQQLNPPDVAALSTSLDIKEYCPETHITLIYLGGVSGERWIREGLAVGCDDALRIWCDETVDLRASAKALILSRVAEIVGFELILTGSRSLDSASEQLGILMACHLGVPHVNSGIEVEIEQGGQRIIVTKRLEGGFHERIQSPLPSVVSMEANGIVPRTPSLSGLLNAMERDIPCWDLARIGIPVQECTQSDSLLRFGPLRFPKPRVRPLNAPDISLPTFDRIRKLLEGTMQRRGGRVMQQNEDAMVEELFQTLLHEGWLSHLRKT